MNRLPLFIIACLVLVQVMDLAGCEGGGQEADEADDDDDDNGSDGDSDTDIDMDVDGDADSDADGDTDDTDGESCRFIDIVIVVDPSGSMSEELQAFRDDVFPAFAQKLAQVSEDLDDFLDGLSWGLGCSIVIHIKDLPSAEDAWRMIFKGLGKALREVFEINPYRKGVAPGVKANLS